MQIRARVVWVLFLLIVLCSCSLETESSGALEMDVFTEASIQPVFEFTESDSVMFQSINAVKFDDYGNILVRDFRLRYITMLDQNGNFLQKIGRRGKGPGEFVLIGSFITKDDELIVTDRVSRKMEVFAYRDSVYEHRRTINFNDQASYGSPEGITDKGILVRKGKPIAADQQKFSPIRMSIINLINHEGRLMSDSIATYPTRESLVKESGEFVSMAKAFGNRGYEVFDGDNRIYTLWSDSLKVNYYTLDGEKGELFSYDVSPVEITDAEKDSVLNRKEEPQKSVLDRQFPTTKPLVNAMLVDDQNRFWIELNARDLGNRWFVFDRDGTPLFVMDKPHPGAEIQDVKQEKVLWNYTNEQGIPAVVMGELARK